MWIDFFCIELATDETRKFDTLIRDALKLKGRSRSVELRGSYYRLNEARELKDGSWIGNMLRTRMDRAAYLSRIDGETEDLELDEDQGLGDDTWFLYEPLRRCLLLQRNWSNGCRPDAFEKYFEQLFKLDNVELKPLITPEADQKLGRLQKVTSFELAIANPHDLDRLLKSGVSGKAAAEMMRTQGSRTVTIINGLGQGKRNRSMDIASIVREARNLSRQLDNGIKRLKVGGYLEDGENIQEIDLIVDRVKHRGHVEVINRKLSSSGCQRLLVDAYNRYRGTIAEILPAS